MTHQSNSSSSKPPLLPLAKVIELTVTVLPVPTFPLLKVEVFEVFKVSVPIKPESVNEVVALLVASYTLLVREAVVVGFYNNISCNRSMICY